MLLHLQRPERMPKRTEFGGMCDTLWDQWSRLLQYDDDLRERAQVRPRQPRRLGAAAALAPTCFSKFAYVLTRELNSRCRRAKFCLLASLETI